MTQATADLGFTHVFRPPSEGGPPLTLLLLHGTGGDEQDLIPLGRALADGAAMLSPRGQVLEGGAPRFFRRLAPGVFDEADLVARSADLARFVAEAAIAYSFDARRVLAVGYSNGANIAASLLLLHPATLCGASLFQPMLPLTPERLPDLADTPVFIGAGRADPWVSQEDTLRLARLLQSAGAPVTLNWHDGGHQLAESTVKAARTWLRLTGLAGA